MTANGDRTVWPRAEIGDARSAIVGRAIPIRSDSLAGHDESGSRLLHQRLHRYKMTAVMRCHEHVNRPGLAQQLGEADVFEVAREQEPMPAVFDQQNEAANVFVALWSRLGRVKHVEGHVSGAQSIAAADYTHRHSP